jgi:hypothetical protein
MASRSSTRIERRWPAISRVSHAPTPRSRSAS